MKFVRGWLVPLAFGLAVVASGCHCGRVGRASPLETVSLGGPLPDAATMRDRYLLVGDRLPSLRARAQRGWKAWERLLEWCADALHDGTPADGSGAENFAVAYLVGGDAELGREAVSRAKRLMARELDWDSYLAFGDLLRGVAIVRDLCEPVLTAEEREALEGYLDRAMHELWFANRGSGWGLEDPGNNYHMAFLEGTAHGGLVLAKYGHRNADRYLALLQEKFESPHGVLAYLAARGAGGEFCEGTNYGQRSKQRLASALAGLASMGGPERVRRLPFLRESILFATHSLAPDGKSLLPAGDLARDSAMLVSPYDRDYVQTMAWLVDDDESRSRAQWFLEHAAPSYEAGGFRFGEALYKDVVFALEAAPRGPEDLPRVYVARGSGWVLARSSWRDDAVFLGISGARTVDQSHAHLDVGSFVLFQGGWQAVDASTFSRSGGLWEAGAHNMVTVPSHDRRPAEVRGVTRLGERDGVLYAEVDAGGLLKARRDRRDVVLAESQLRALVWLEPDTLVIHDRIASTAPHEWRLHVAAQPELRGARGFQATHEDGGLALEVLVGGAARVEHDSDLDGGESTSHRIVVTPAEGADRGRYLAVVRVARGRSPTLKARRVTVTEGLDAVLVGDTIVAFPSLSPSGGVSTGGYDWEGDVRRHVVAGLAGGVGVVFDKERRHAELKRGARAVETDGFVVATP